MAIVRVYRLVYRLWVCINSFAPILCVRVKFVATTTRTSTAIANDYLISFFLSSYVCVLCVLSVVCMTWAHRTAVIVVEWLVVDVISRRSGFCAVVIDRWHTTDKRVHSNGIHHFRFTKRNDFIENFIRRLYSPWMYNSCSCTHSWKKWQIKIYWSEMCLHINSPLNFFCMFCCEWRVARTIVVGPLSSIQHKPML